MLFKFQQPTHNVAVFRGADLKNAIAAGLVKGFPGASGSAGAVATKQVVTPVVPAPVVVETLNLGTNQNIHCIEENNWQKQIASHTQTYR